MSRDKQIEEITKTLNEATFGVNKHIIADHIHKPEAIEEIATHLYDAGYRKTTDVAEEIFTEIEKGIKASLTIHLEEINKEHIKDTPLYDRHSGIIFALRRMDDFIAELKKKYTEEGK